jgi:predicted lipoprotein with Yx(FWY)xxD motif
MRMRTVVAGVGIVAAVAIVTAGAFAADERSRSNVSVHKVLVSSRAVPGIGRILVNSKGLTLYMFVPDKRKKVTCVSVCAKIWPPLKLPRKAKAVASRGVKAKLLGVDRDPAGGRVVTYHGWPLYTYLGDRHPGDVTGQALDLNGGLWYVLARNGALIKKKPQASGSATTTTTTKTTTQCSDDDADGDEDGGGPDDGDGCL